MTENFFQDYDPSYNIIFHAHWSDFEEDGWIFIFEKEGNYFTLEGGYCLMVKDHTEPTWENLELISEEYVLELMEEWVDDEDEWW